MKPAIPARIDWMRIAKEKDAEIARLRVKLEEVKIYLGRRGMLYDDGDALDLYNKIEKEKKENE